MRKGNDTGKRLPLGIKGKNRLWIPEPFSAFTDRAPRLSLASLVWRRKGHLI